MLVIPPDQLPLAEGLSRDFLLHHRLCPWHVTAAGTLVVAADEASILDGADELAFAYGRRVEVERTTPDELDRLVERITNRAERSIELARIGGGDDDLARDFVTWPTSRR